MARPGEPRWGQARLRIERICAEPRSDRELRAALLDEIKRVVSFDSYAWVGTDPSTTVGASPLAEVPSLDVLPAMIRLKYLTSTNRWTSLPADRVVTLLDATDHHPERSMVWRELLHRYGVADVASAVLRDAYGCWGFLDLWRDAAFSAAECAFLTGVLPGLTRSVRASLAATFTPSPAGALPDGPAVLLISDMLEPELRTPHAEAHLRALLPTSPEHSPVPAVALNVAAQLLAVEAGVDAHEPVAGLHQSGGRWVQVRAARLDPRPRSGATIAVTIEQATSERRLGIYCRAVGLTPRETQLLSRLVEGADTRGVARALGIGEHTVNDHLRSIFAKAGTNSRRRLIANAHG
jgi:DNA-binding CsgD family transcriptional regulator